MLANGNDQINSFPGNLFYFLFLHRYLCFELLLDDYSIPPAIREL